MLVRGADLILALSHLPHEAEELALAQAAAPALVDLGDEAHGILEAQGAVKVLQQAQDPMVLQGAHPFAVVGLEAGDQAPVLATAEALARVKQIDGLLDVGLVQATEPVLVDLKRDLREDVLHWLDDQGPQQHAQLLRAHIARTRGVALPEGSSVLAAPPSPSRVHEAGELARIQRAAAPVRDGGPDFVEPLPGRKEDASPAQGTRELAAMDLRVAYISQL
mmetsp:Transcript_52676/g.171252  ORF Transcript_52676/g.171252 Transcript_52676/m.171252 type:complete len:221 (+) Transcript_52676:1797-2459(+)